MSFIAILIALGLLQYWGTASPLHNDEWFNQWQQFGLKISAQPWVQLAVVVFIPVLLLCLVMLLFGQWLWGLVELAIAVVVLMYSFGRGEFNQRLEEYNQCWRDGNYEKLPVVIQAVDPEYIPHVEEGLPRTHIAARDGFIYAGFTRLFVVLFWFVLLGPAGALAYRLLRLFQQQQDSAPLQLLRSIMEWPAGRLFGLTMAFVGNFGSAMASWFSSVMNVGMTTRQVIHANALAALEQNMNWLTGKFAETYSLEQQGKLARAEVRDIQQLLTRSLAFAVVAIAIYQIII